MELRATIYLKDVLVIKDLKFNLISVSRLKMSGFEVLFSNGKCVITAKVLL